jgi:selenocysteine lyase/cysteine desulfurase
LPAGAALAAQSIQREVADVSALNAQSQVPARNPVSEKIEAARQQVAAEVGLVSTAQSPAPRSEVTESIDRVQEAAQRYWQAATASGRRIIAAKIRQASNRLGGLRGKLPGRKLKPPSRATQEDRMRLKSDLKLIGAVA